MSDSDWIQTYHRIETGQVLGTPDPVIEVYGDGSMGWYEWRLTWQDERPPVETEGGYGSPEVALRDALCFVYGLPTEELSLKAKPADAWAEYQQLEWKVRVGRINHFRRFTGGVSTHPEPPDELEQLDRAIGRAQRDDPQPR